MALDENTEALMLAYVYGELTASAAKAFEARMDADAELRAEVEGLIATRDLLGQDAAFGARSGIDAPPPHLVDAIMKAEALMRPAEIRQAALAKSGADAAPPFTARLARWLLGGGALAGAAAFLFVVTRASVDMAPSSKIVTVASEEAPAVAMPSPSSPWSSKMNADGAIGDKPKEQPVERPAEPLADAVAAQGAGIQPLAKDQAPSPAPAADDARADPTSSGDSADMLAGLADAKVKRDALKEEAGGGAGLGATLQAAPKGAATGTMSVAPTAPPPPSPPPPPPASALPEPATSADKDAPARNLAKKAESGSDDGFAFDEAPRAKAKAESKPAPRPAPKPPAPEKAAAGPGRAEADLGVTAEAAPAKPTVLGREEVETRRRALAEKKTAGSRGRGASGGEMERARTVELANIALMTGQRELARKSYLLALDEFTRAAELDPDGAVLGATPVLGQMRALVALKRPLDAVRVSRVLLRRDLKQVDVVPALVLGAETAERVGDLRNAREIYSRLLDAPAERTRARAALGRISAAEQPRPSDSEAAEAASEPAAASPP